MSAKKSDVSEVDIREDDVRAEHVTNVNTAGHWAYLLAVLIGGFVLMVGFIALLGATASQ